MTARGGGSNINNNNNNNNNNSNNNNNNNNNAMPHVRKCPSGRMQKGTAKAAYTGTKTHLRVQNGQRCGYR
eukprot:399664-Pyramimonas_sp.AAC.3